MKCRGCGRALRTPESIARGLGPTCWARLPAEQRAAAEPPATAAPRAEPLPIDDPARRDLPRPVRTQPITTVPSTGDLL